MLILLSGCITIYNPATEKTENLFIDTQSEVALGRDIDIQMQRKFKIEKGPYANNRLSAIGQKIAAVSDRQDLNYHFRIIKDKELNAFALPGGFVYVNSAVMEAANDDELACVVAHEIGHIAARHSVKKLQAALGYQIILDIAMGFGGSRQTYKAMDIVFDIIGLGYSRQDESLADRLSVKYAKKGGLNPYGAVTFFEKLKKEAEKQGPGFNLVFLSSHPPIEERIQNVKREIETLEKGR